MVHMVQKRNNLELRIVEFLLNRDGHVREIAKILNESHSSVSRRLNELKKENVVEFKVTGKNKIFHLKNNLVAKNYIFKSEFNKLIKLLERYPEFEVIFEEILKICDAKLIILFGSYAKGTANKNSDIDIYIETKNRKVKKLVENVNSKINAKIGLFNVDSHLIKEIIKNHVIIKGIEVFYDK